MQVSTFLKSFYPLHLHNLCATAQLPIKTGHAVSSAEYGRLPLSFEANRGQADPSVQFLAHGQGYTLFLQEGEAALTLRSAASPSQAGGETSLLRLQLVGAHRDSAIRSEDQQITRTNYFFGSDAAKWRTDIPNYGRVRYIGIYEGIDLVYYGSQYDSQHGDQRRLEHDFIVAPNADPGEIKLAMKGARKVRIDAATGDLILNTGKGSSQLRLLKPVTYQQFNGRRTEVISGYKLLAGNRIGFSLGRYNHAETLVIDPILVYSTYLGGSGALSADQFYQIEGTGNGDQGNGIAVDASGNAPLSARLSPPARLPLDHRRLPEPEQRSCLQLNRLCLQAQPCRHRPRLLHLSRRQRRRYGLRHRPRRSRQRLCHRRHILHRFSRHLRCPADHKPVQDLRRKHRLCRQTEHYRHSPRLFDLSPAAAGTRQPRRREM